ncbi:MAG: T9SS type A sorting domain-containing protein [Bacteroidetes bacterium]|nr:T9SS type A sorting domain-containing protein [Bacteroidota bacterium]
MLVYPNPTTQDLRIQSESPFSKVTLQDLQGRVLMSQTFDAVQNQTLDMSAISSGVYLLTIEGEMGRVTSKVVKQ